MAVLEQRGAFICRRTLKVVRGPFQQLDAVFDGYLDGQERVAVLLSLMNAERRVVMPANMVIAAE
jgi:hypothetical protein